MTILYAVVAKGKNVLAEFTNKSGNFVTITRVLLGKINSDSDQKMSYVYDQYIFHYIVENHILYLCMCDEQSKRRIPFAFLNDIKTKFISSYGDQAQTALAFAMNSGFSPYLSKQIEYFNSPNADSFTQINDKLDDVKNVMVQNIESVLERGEKLELLVDKSERLQQQSFQFAKSANKLKKQMWWRKIKLYSIISLLVIMAIWLFSSFICGFDYKKC
jgi:vesicle-associated membrane protein 7